MSWQMSPCASTTYKGQNQLATYITQNVLTAHSIAGVSRYWLYRSRISKIFQYKLNKAQTFFSDSIVDKEIFQNDMLINLTPRILY